MDGPSYQGSRVADQELICNKFSQQDSSMYYFCPSKPSYSDRLVFSTVQPTETRKITYREQQVRLRRALANHKQIRHGNVLDTVEKGVAYPVLHVQWQPPNSNCTSDHTSYTSSPNATRPKKKTSLDSCYSSLDSRAQSVVESNQETSLLSNDALGPGVCLQQGLYEEVKRIDPDIRFSSRDKPDNKAYIILGFKTVDTGFSSVLESTWRDWTGARNIYLRLHNEFDLEKIVFYRRTSPISNLDLFMYLVVVELWNVTSNNMMRLQDFVQRIRVERLNGYVSLYRDLGGPTDDDDSNYHSDSQDSLLTVSSSDDANSLRRRKKKGKEEECESDQGIEMTSYFHETIRTTSQSITRWAGQKACADLPSRVVETITLETEKQKKLPAI